MSMTPFYTEFRDLAFQEMRSVTLLGERDGIPPGTYGFLESYCDEPDCDCRTVFLNVVDAKRPAGEFLATINYGWEDLAYYTKWVRGDREWAREMKGPGLSSAMVRQSPLAPAFLVLFREVLEEPQYVERLARHYHLFRDAIARKSATKSGLTAAAASRREPGRNEPCPCGSGRRYKVCCQPNSAGAPPLRTEPTDPARVRERLKQLRLPQNADQPPSIFFAGLEREFVDLGAALARLASEDEDERVSGDAVMMMIVALRDGSVSRASRDKIVRSAAPMLQAAFEDPRVSDDRKYRLGPLLALCGIEYPSEEYEAHFRDFAAIQERESTEYASELSPLAASMERLLCESGVIQHLDPTPMSEAEFKKAFDFGAMLAEKNPAAGVVFLCVTAATAAEQGMALDDARVALDLVRRTGTPEAVWHLSELGGWPGPGVVQTTAAELAEEMRKEGAIPAVHAHRTFSHGLVSAVDGVGSRSLLLFFRSAAGGMDGLTVLVNDEVGIKDVWCVFDEGSTVEDHLRRETAISFAPLSLPLARELLQDTLALHRERGTIPPGRFLLYRPHLGGEPLRARKRTVNLGAYALEIVVRSPDLAAGSHRLCRHEDWREFWFAGDEVFEFVREQVRPRPDQKPRSKSRFAAGMVDRFARAAAVHERARLIRRMAAKLETESWAGRATDPLNRLAARTWLVLSEGLAPFHEVPFVRELAREGLARVSVNVALGFRNQREVNAGRDRE